MNSTALLFVKALALVFVLEGVVPFLSPKAWREFFSSLIQADDLTLRSIGLTSMVIGTCAICILHAFF